MRMRSKQEANQQLNLWQQHVEAKQHANEIQEANQLLNMRQQHVEPQYVAAA